MEYLRQVSWASVVIVPIVLVVVGTLFKRLGRRDGDRSPRRNDFAVATTVLLMTFATVIRDLQAEPHTGHYGFHYGWLLGLLVCALVSTDHDRHGSWELDGNGVRTDRKLLARGIILPDLITVIIFVSYQLWKGLLHWKG